MKESEVAVIGAGPVGIFASFALGQVGLKAVVIDTLQEIGGQCTALYPEKPIYDIPTRSALNAASLVNDLIKQAEPYGPRYVLGRRVETVTGCLGDFRLALSDGSHLQAAAIVIAAGAGAFGPNRPPIANIEAFEGRSIFYSVLKPERFQNKKVVIAGGGDSAIDWAIVLADIAASVTVVHRRTLFRAAPATMAALESKIATGAVRLAAPRMLRNLEGENGMLASVIVADENDDLENIPADALLCFFGLVKDMSALTTWQIDADRNGIPVDPATMATARKGLFAIGDVTQYPGKLKLILTGFAEASLAAHSVRACLYPDRPFHFEYSTSRGVPAA
jgi:thioredoxin reductase (NADPH)